MNKLYQVDIDRVPADDAALVKALRVVGKMSLKDATEVHAELARREGGTVVAGVELAVAEHVAKAMSAAGARVTIAESSVRSPCRADPAAAARFVWNRFRQLETA